MAVTESAFDRNATNINVIYYLYLAAIVLGVTAVVGLIMAYMNQGTNDDWLDSHYTYQVRTFWIGLLYVAIGVVLTMMVIGVVVLACVFIWWIVRNLKGLKLAGARQPIPDPTTWKW